MKIKHIVYIKKLHNITRLVKITRVITIRFGGSLNIVNEKYHIVINK